MNERDKRLSGFDMSRCYLDHNATAPLRPEARQAMVEAMDVAGNPSSVHQEGRAAKRLMESARAQIAEALGAGNADIIFTSGATEAAALCLRGGGYVGSDIEHDAVHAWIEPSLSVDARGHVSVPEPDRSVLQLANSETGILQSLPEGLAVSEITQAVGRIPFSYSWAGVGAVFLSSHKIGGPKGIGALIVPQGADISPHFRGGGQEMGRRSGTENIIGIAGFAAATKTALRDLADGIWSRVEEFRNILEKAIEERSPETIFVGKGADRLPNTSCFVTPGWKGETQVMAMDLAGFAISAGSACSSGKVKASRVLQAMGFSAEDAASSVRVSLGPDTTKGEVLRFADAWTEKLVRQRKRSA
jgi:cysteine desulfurase